MNLFRRAIRFFLIVAGLVAAVVAAATAFFLRYLLRPPRQPLWATPEDAGMPFEEVEFPARDGLRLSGWFIPAGRVPPAQSHGDFGAWLALEPAGRSG